MSAVSSSSNPYHNIFQEAMRTVEARFTPTEYRFWLEDLALSRYEDDVLVLTTTYRIKRDRITKRYQAVLENIFREHFTSLKNIEIHETPPKAAVPALTTHTSAQTATLPPQATQPPSRTRSSGRNSLPAPANVLKEHIFENFLVVEENELAYGFAQKVIKQFARNSPLYFYGAVGTGKTHLLQAVANEIRRHFPFYKIRYVMPDKFIQEFRNSIFSKTDREFRTRYQSTDLLIIDDVQFFSGKKKSCIEFFHIFNSIHIPGKQMLFASDVSPAELAEFDLRLKSRLSASVIVNIPTPAYDSRKRLLAYLAQQQQFQLKESLSSFLAKKLPGNVRELKGAITTLKETAMLYQEKKAAPPAIDRAFCERALSHRFTAPDNPLTTEKAKVFPVEMILKEVCAAGEVTLKELRSQRKTKHLAQIRKYAAYLLKKHTNLSITEIGDYLGGKTPSAISYSLNSIEKVLSTDKLTQLFFTKVEQQLTLGHSKP